MPVSRSPVRSVGSLPYPGSPLGTSRNIVFNAPDSQDNSLVLSRTTADDTSRPPPASPTARRRRTPNAFILYRSYIISNRMYPTELNHQSDVSRYVAEMWRSMPASARSVFFKMAEEEKQRVQLDSPGSEPYRRRRSRSNKNITTQGNSPHGESSPGSDADIPLPTTSMSFSSCPFSIPAPSFESTALLCNNAFASSAPSAPQPTHAIPPHLLNWGRELDGTKNDVVNCSEPEPTWSSFHPSTPYQISYQSDPACFDSLNDGMLDFQLLLDMSTDLMSALMDTPPFGVYLPA